MPRPVAKLGLAFVAWTRATKWSKVTFQSLPPLEEFLAVRLAREFILRKEFEARADTLHDVFFVAKARHHGGDADPSPSDASTALLDADTKAFRY